MAALKNCSCPIPTNTKHCNENALTNSQFPCPDCKCNKTTMKASQSQYQPPGKIVSLLVKIREPIAEYQERKGFSTTQSISFIDLLRIICQGAYDAAIAVITMLMSMGPLLEGFLFILRFVLDKIIEITQTRDFADKGMKILVLFGETIILGLLLLTICGIILLPVWVLFTHLFGKLYVMLSK